MGSSQYFKVVDETVYVWLPGVNQLAVLDLDGKLRDLIRTPFRSVFGRDVKSMDVRSLVFLPDGRMILNSMGYRKGQSPVGGWFFSDDLGRHWRRMTTEFQDPWRVRLIGFAEPSEAVTADFTFGRGIVGFCPVKF